MTLRSIVIVAVVSVAAGCSKQQPAPAQSATQSPPSPAASAAADASASQVTGPVLETMDAAAYTYVRVKSDSGDVWAAAPQFPVKVGDRVVVPLEMPMKNFHSQSLNRDFPLLYFVSRITRDGETASAGRETAPPAPNLVSSHGGTPPASPAIEQMPPPAGGTSIGDLWAHRKALGGKTVTVRGTVVKFNPGILGKNWVHLQDGTGKAADKTNDITVTTAEDVMTAVGDTITVTGTAVLDKDLGEGYAYPVLIENARIVATAKGAAR
jgi:hypothetical protein